MQVDLQVEVGGGVWPCGPLVGYCGHERLVRSQVIEICDADKTAYVSTEGVAGSVGWPCGPKVHLISQTQVIWL